MDINNINNLLNVLNRTHSNLVETKNILNSIKNDPIAENFSVANDKMLGATKEMKNRLLKMKK